MTPNYNDTMAWGLHNFFGGFPPFYSTFTQHEKKMAVFCHYFLLWWPILYKQLQKNNIFCGKIYNFWRFSAIFENFLRFFVSKSFFQPNWHAIILIFQQIIHLLSFITTILFIFFLTLNPSISLPIRNSPDNTSTMRNSSNSLSLMDCRWSGNTSFSFKLFNKLFYLSCTLKASKVCYQLWLMSNAISN